MRVSRSRFWIPVLLVISLAAAGCDEAPAPTTPAAAPVTSIPASSPPGSPSAVPPSPVPVLASDTPSPSSPPPTATAEHFSPTTTQTALPTPVLASRAEQIVGTWQGLGKDAMYQRFSGDGTCRGAFALDNIEVSPNHTCVYRFDGTDLLVTDVTLRGLPPCPESDSVYQVQILDYSRIKFVKVRDSCGPRVNTTAVVHRRMALSELRGIPKAEATPTP